MERDSRYFNGVRLALLTAVISGFSVYINKFGISFWTNSDSYTTAKNVIAAVFLTAVLVLWRKAGELKGLSRRTWLELFAIGLVGGSIPFLLFFKALTLIPASEAAFVHKTLFLWIALFSYPFLRERIGATQLAALGVLSGGIFLLGAPAKWIFGTGFLLALGATLLWAIENIIAKRVLETVPALIVGWARMFFGSIILIMWIAASGEIGSLVPTSLAQTFWAFAVGAVLFGYVSVWYTALKYTPATVASSILTLAAPITTILESILIRSAFPTEIILPLAVMIFGIAFLIIQFRRIVRNFDPKNAPAYS